jgi:hypothetical protein
MNTASVEILSLRTPLRQKNSPHFPGKIQNSTHICNMNNVALGHWSLLLDLACEDGELSACIPGLDRKNRVCQCYYFETEESAARFCKRVLQCKSLPHWISYRPNKKMVGIRFAQTATEIAATEALQNIN